MGRTCSFFGVLFILLMIGNIHYSLSQINVFPDYFKDKDAVFFTNKDTEYFYKAQYVTTSSVDINYPKLALAYSKATYVILLYLFIVRNYSKSYHFN